MSEESFHNWGIAAGQNELLVRNYLHNARRNDGIDRSVIARRRNESVGVYRRYRRRGNPLRWYGSLYGGMAKT
jgi:hypothetical protein